MKKDRLIVLTDAVLAIIMTILVLELEKQTTPSLDVLETTANILGKHGKSDEEIMKFLEYHFPISSAIMQKIIDARKNKEL